MVNNDVTNEPNINDLIEKGTENTLTLSNTNINSKNEDCEIIYPIQNILRQHYRPLLLRYCKKITLSDVAFIKYKYKPKSLSYDLYGGTELWHLILWLNDMITVTEFTKKELVLLEPSAISVINNILEKEENNINLNREDPIKKMN